MFNVPDEIRTSVKQATQTEAIQLPFSVPYFVWQNPLRGFTGEDSRAKGGWTASAESYENALVETGASAIHNKVMMVNDKGENYEAYTVRALFCAVIGRRERWIDNRSHSQTLVIAAKYIRETKVYEAWLPAVLVTKGYASKYIKNALAEWSSKTTQARNTFANKLPPNFFYVPLGTFGDKVEYKQVGKGSAQKTIVACQTWVPSEVTEGYLKSCFVGSEVATQMGMIAEAAKEWLAAWKDQGDRQPEHEEVEDTPIGQTYGDGPGNDDIF